MKQREKDIQELCKQIVNMNVDFWDNPSGGYEHTCPICQVTLSLNTMDISLEDIDHELNCGYLIAKDLSTKRLESVNPK